MKLFLVLAIGLAAVSAVPYNNQRIIGGSVTTIGAYPFGVAVLTASGVNFIQECGGTIINNRSILSAAHCFVPNLPGHWRIRVGSSYANSGGYIHNIQRILNHPAYNSNTLDCDISLLRIPGTFYFTNNVRQAQIAGPNRITPDNAAVWAIGWGRTVAGLPNSRSEQLRHVQVWVVNQAVCRNRYAEIRLTVTDNMLCAGWLDVGGRDSCQGDSGGPLLHDNVVVGVTSWGESCAHSRYPGVNTRVSRFSMWIQDNA